MATTKTDSRDLNHMRAALALARRGLGQVWPNPAVGCVLTKRGAVIGRGWTQSGGRPHAETQALARAGAGGCGATAYVSLEPCAHHGRTPPCAEALASAGIARVVVACLDPDPRVAGKGVAMLQDAGVKVEEGVAADEAQEINAGFLSMIERGRPLVTLKVATSLDGCIATHGGESRWITGDIARAHVHLLRARYDAVAVGSGTVLADRPELTCRLPGLLERSPVRVVFDGRLRTPLTSPLVATARSQPLWILTLQGVDPVRLAAMEELGVEVLEVVAGPDGSPHIGGALEVLAERGITRLLVEGGQNLSAAFLRASLVDRLVWFRAPKWIGADGIPAAEALGFGALADVLRFRRTDLVPVGKDVMETYISEREV